MITVNPRSPILRIHLLNYAITMPYECFYNLPCRIENCHVIWRTEPKLFASIELLVSQIEPSRSIDEWKRETQLAHYLFEQLKLYPEEKLFNLYWVAFLLNRCEKVTKTICSFMPAIPSQIFFADLFMMSFEVICKPSKFFVNFDEQRLKLDYWYPTLKRFSDRKIKQVLFPKVREITGIKTLGQTNLGLASRASRKQVIIALQSSKSHEEISPYLLAWQCFQEVRKSMNLNLKSFQPEHFQQIADRYNQLLKREQNINGEKIKLCLESIGLEIRRLLELSVTSLDRQTEESETSLIDKLASELSLNQDFLWDREIEQRIVELQNFIHPLLENLEKIDKQLLLLRYALCLKQTQMSRELGNIQQYQISRQLERLRDHIFREICQWIERYLKIEPCSQGIDEIEAVLSNYYQVKIDRYFEIAIQSLGEYSQNLLKMFYINRLNSADIAQKMHKSKLEIDESIEEIKQWLSIYMTEKIEADTQLQFQPQGAAIKSISVLIEDRLQTIFQQY